ncbi:MAG TPA: hypothetical protein VFE61_10240 [Candidatus Sulfotelmatobacter sp.]|jgi:photosystem II stability/assembly factor-like uncharacterized protein|nr:hypothetical protein [Candidatus Sulfotelmatobacter sp.]
MKTTPSRALLAIPLAFVFMLNGVPASSQSVAPETFSGLKYRLIGPFRGGRVAAVSGITGNGTTFYFGAVDGGVWKTTDAGTVWTPIFDGQPVASIGALAVAPSDPKVIYAGTGESDIRSNLASGDGVYKSTDSGQTWHNFGLRDSRQISRIAIDPRDANVVYVGVLGHAYGPNSERGLFKSSDGGAHWSKVFDPSPDIGVADLAMATDQPGILFAASWCTRRPPWSTYAPTDCPGSSIYRSKDAGETWSRLISAGLPDEGWGRPSVAVSADGKRVYALIDAAGKSGLYRSDDGGDTWTLSNSDKRLTSRAWYFGNITVDPGNANVIYIPNVALYRSDDGGKTISIVRGAPGGDDYHQIWVDPKNSSRMVLGTDQGATISVDNGKTWTSWYNQPTAQLYHAITDDKFPYTVYGAQQDSGSAAVMSRTDHGQITPRDWFLPGGSESGYIAPDPANPDIVYLTSTYGGVARFNLRTSFSQDITPWPLPTWNTEISGRKYRDPWTPVLVFSPADKRSLYLGTQYVMRTTDGGLHWHEISPDLTGARTSATSSGAKTEDKATVGNAMERGYGVVFTIAPSSLDPKLIWAGSDTGLIHVTRDGGETWKEVTPKAISKWSRISFVEASHFNAGEAYVAVDRHRLDDQSPYLFRTQDYGATWRPITDGILSPSFARVIREDPRTKGLLYVGTEFGIYVSFDDGNHWQSLQLNLPVTSVQDIAIHDDDLIVATHGRSFWILDDITPLRQTHDAEQAGAAAWLYQPAAAIRLDNDSFLGTPIPPEEPTSENPPNGAIFDYVLKSPAANVKLEIVDAKRNLHRSFSSEEKEQKRPPLPIADRWFSKPQHLEKSPGMHRFVWDLAWGADVGGDEESEYGSPRAPRAVPGSYEVRLTVDGKTWTQPLSITMDPRSPAKTQDLEQQLKLGEQIYNEVLQCRRVIAEIGSAQKQLSGLNSKLAVRPELKARAEDVTAKIKAILSGDAEKTNEMGLETASAGLGGALRVVESGDRAVPAQALEVYKLASTAMSKRVDEWKHLKAGRLAQLNEEFGKAGLEPISASATKNLGRE